MLKSRLIPCLLIHNNGLYKTVNFKNAKYVGDPINAVKIFNEKEVDELIVLDIDATVSRREPDYKLIQDLAFECRMPLCYGGGIKTLDQALYIFGLGVEKIALSSAVINEMSIIQSLAKTVGSQSVVVVIDVKKNKLTKAYNIYIHNGTIKTDLNLWDYISEIQSQGVGEIVINSIDNDGLMQGYDLNLVERVFELARVPITVMGGAGSVDDFVKVIANDKIIGLAAGSFFVFKGKYKAVLINYPQYLEKEKILK